MRFCAVAMLLMSGCGYVVSSAYQSDILTIAVPTFTNHTFRRGIEFQLTEAVQKEIQNRTHFRLVNQRDADTVLTGRIVDTRKDVLGESAQDDPRELQLTLSVQVTWTDQQTGRVLAQQSVPLSTGAMQLIGQASFAPEVGQSLATGTQATVDRLARQIVNMMEAPW